MKNSVVIAYYNGKQYIKEQVDSILGQLGAEDELIISVDSDQDGSGELLREMAENDGRMFIPYKSGEIEEEVTGAKKAVHVLGGKI